MPSYVPRIMQAASLLADSTREALQHSQRTCCLVCVPSRCKPAACFPMCTRQPAVLSMQALNDSSGCPIQQKRAAAGGSWK